MTEDDRLATLAFLKLQDDVKAVIREVVLEMFTTKAEYLLIQRLQEFTLGSAEFAKCVRQVISNQMQK